MLHAPSVYANIALGMAVAHELCLEASGIVVRLLPRLVEFGEQLLPSITTDRSPLRQATQLHTRMQGIPRKVPVKVVTASHLLLGLGLLLEGGAVALLLLQHLFRLLHLLLNLYQLLPAGMRLILGKRPPLTLSGQLLLQLLDSFSEGLGVVVPIVHRRHGSKSNAGEPTAVCQGPNASAMQAVDEDLGILVEQKGERLVGKHVRPQVIAHSAAPHLFVAWDDHTLT
jgi:hypothetical protein